jgi:3-oxoacyl-[acyl-carrier-protein] synthase II
VTGLAVTGWEVLCPAGIGPRALGAALAGEAAAQTAGPRRADRLYAEPMPPERAAHALVDFEVRDHLERKGTAFLDRCTALALVACGRALADSGLTVDDGNRQRVGVVLGTTAGSFKSMSDYTRETLIEDRPYLVNPALFPNTVMNCAAGQTAIRFGLRGPNTTIAGGQLALLSVLRYAARALGGAGAADALLAGVVEELTPHTAWATHRTAATPGSPGAGEGAAVFVVERVAEARRAGRSVDAELLAVTTGFRPGGGSGDGSGGGAGEALAACVRRALAAASIAPGEISAVVTGEPADAAEDRVESAAVTAALGGAPAETIRVKRWLGEGQAASAGLGLAALLAFHRDDPGRDGRLSLITARTPEGALGAAVVRGWSRVGPDRR